MQIMLDLDARAARLLRSPGSPRLPVMLSAAAGATFYCMPP
jgi:hypothetical protein